MTDEARIEISPNGPYILHGDVPLLEMAPVHSLNGEPIAWHTLRELDVPERPVALCRCGASAQKPLCDGVCEANGFNGAETAEEPHTTRARLVERGDNAIVDDPALCRCGQSENKPFCDGTHASIHFDER